MQLRHITHSDWCEYEAAPWHSISGSNPNPNGTVCGDLCISTSQGRKTIVCKTVGKKDTREFTIESSPLFSRREVEFENACICTFPRKQTNIREDNHLRVHLSPYPAIVRSSHSVFSRDSRTDGRAAKPDGPSICLLTSPAVVVFEILPLASHGSR